MKVCLISYIRQLLQLTMIILFELFSLKYPEFLLECRKLKHAQFYKYSNDCLNVIIIDITNLKYAVCFLIAYTCTLLGSISAWPTFEQIQPSVLPLHVVFPLYMHTIVWYFKKVCRWNPCEFWRAPGEFFSINVQMACKWIYSCWNVKNKWFLWFYFFKYRFYGN